MMQKAKRRVRAEQKAEVEKKAEAAAPTTVEFVVRRGALRRYDLLKQKTADLPVTLTWDRRVAQRRTGSEEATTDRRGTDRRQTPPYTWEVADFVVVERSPQAPAPRRKNTPRNR